MNINLEKINADECKAISELLCGCTFHAQFKEAFLMKLENVKRSEYKI